MRLGRYVSTTAALAVLFVGLSAVSAGAAQSTQSPPAYNGPLNSVTYPQGGAGPGGGAPSQPQSSSWSCAVTVSNVVQDYGPGSDLYDYASQHCVGAGYGPMRVGTSIWRNRWWGGQEVAGWNYSPWTYASSTDKNSQYICANDTGYFSYYGYALGEAQSGDYSQEVRSLDNNNWYCG